jgi:hypothetical protein
MKFTTRLIIPAALGLLVTSAAAQNGTVIPVRDREAILALADRLLAHGSVDNAADLNLLRDPFEVMLASVPVVETNNPVVVTAAPRYNDGQILDAIAPRVNPTGSVRIGGVDYLLFGQKRLKVGEMLTITYEGSVYMIEITSIERNNFRIRLNSEELVRPIK